MKLGTNDFHHGNFQKEVHVFIMTYEDKLFKSLHSLTEENGFLLK